MAMHLSQAAAHGLPFVVADVDLSYHPRFLIPAPFRRSIIEDEDFWAACEQGFDSYFDALIADDEQGREVFVKRGYSWDEVAELLVLWVYEAADTPMFTLSPAWLAGFGLGWLSALAFFRHEDAQRGLAVLIALLGGSATILQRS